MKHNDFPELDVLLILLIIAFVTCFVLGCASQPTADPRIPQYAQLCNAGLPAYCVAMQAVYQQADTQAQINAEEGIAAHAHWQNYWAQQQSNWNFINASNDAAIQATMNRMQVR